MRVAQVTRVIGGGPAGSAAAITLCREGVAVKVFEKSAFPRHKVCGEFLSPEAALVFEELGIGPAFRGLCPATIGEASVTIGRSVKRWKLDEPALGISRFALDRFLIEQARTAGAEVVREPARTDRGPVVIACGRQDRAPAGSRHFGFKAHFSGPVNDRIDLLFEQDMYAGINCVESGVTNVCGLASERLLRRFHFNPDALVAATPALAERVRPLTRTMEWLITGPLVYGGRFDAATPPDVYLAGDALGFVDPFTGTGMLAALSTGFLAGRSCARRIPSEKHLRDCRNLLGAQYRAAGFFRKLIGWGIAEKLAWLVPGPALYELTRPKKNRQTLGG